MAPSQDKTTVISSGSQSSKLARIARVLGLLRGYQRDWLRPAFIAGVTLAAYLLPAGIRDASLAGLPPQAGIYACLLSGLVFWLFCSSRYKAITATSAISLLVGGSLTGLAAGDAICSWGSLDEATLANRHLSFFRSDSVSSDSMINHIHAYTFPSEYLAYE